MASDIMVDVNGYFEYMSQSIANLYDNISVVYNIGLTLLFSLGEHETPWKRGQVY